MTFTNIININMNTNINCKYKPGIVCKITLLQNSQQNFIFSGHDIPIHGRTGATFKIVF